MADLTMDRKRLAEAMGQMSAIDLSEKLGCGKSIVSMYLSGQRKPSKMAVQLLALNLGVNPAWLCGLDVPKYSNAKIISRENAPTDDDERVQKLIELVKKLTPEHQELLLAQIRGIVESL